MLVLTRKLGEKVVIDEKIIVTVLQMTSTKVRLGFEAPKQVGVVRSELLPGLPVPLLPMPPRPPGVAREKARSYTPNGHEVRESR